MKILQLTHDWKWTGPAEPMALLAQALREAGHEVVVACPEPPPESNRSLAGELRARGLAPVFALRGERTRLGLPVDADRKALARYLGDEAPDVVHCWHTLDHLLAALVVRDRSLTRRPAVVRTHRSADPLSRAPWSRWLFGPACDGLWCVSEASALENEPLRGGRPILGALGAADLSRFAPELAARGRAALRDELGLEESDIAIGVVARAQAARRFDLLFEAFDLLVHRVLHARLVIYGRGSDFREQVMEPAAHFGPRVVLGGYRLDDYPAALGALDLFTFLVPGSDGTCRALLEAMACGLPPVVTPSGALAEIVEDGASGLHCELSPGSLAAAWERLACDAGLRRDLGSAAARRASREFAPARLAADLESLYRAAVAHRPAQAPGPPPPGVPELSP